ncbi:MAG: type II toxin-antitoxin system VapC family toxin [Acidobacteriota bacterium]
MIFLDTSAIYALADRNDVRHAVAKKSFHLLLEDGRQLLTHNYVVLESMALLQHRLGVRVALEFARDSWHFEIEWVDQTIHREAVGRLSRRTKGKVSLVDQVSFLVMRSRGVDTALAFDTDFLDEGFRLYSVTG